MINPVDEARKWIGVRWKHQGRTTDGIDCVGLIIEVNKAINNSSLDITNYQLQAQDETMLEMCKEYLDRVDLANIQPGDIVVIKFENQRHMGILGDYPHENNSLSLIHAYATHRKVVEHRFDSKWRDRCMAAFRFRGT